MAQSELKTVRVRIEGRVQGVWFRAWTAERAQGLGLQGWVRNCSDGTVEALFSGPEAAVEAMIEACWTGPSAAWVTKVASQPAESPPVQGFRQLPTT